jgi:hypothetical protein
MRNLLSICVLIPGVIYAGDFDQILLRSESPVSVLTSDTGKCIRYKAITIVTKSNQEGAAGEQILVKESSTAGCGWQPDQGWITDSGQASYFIGKSESNLFVDQGTAPGYRSILIYDMHNRQIKYRDGYFPPIEIKNRELKYWQSTAITAVESNCNIYNSETIASGLTPQIQRYVMVNLLSYQIKAVESTPLRCSYIQ